MRQLREGDVMIKRAKLLGGVGGTVYLRVWSTDKVKMYTKLRAEAFGEDIEVTALELIFDGMKRWGYCHYKISNVDAVKHQVAYRRYASKLEHYGSSTVVAGAFPSVKPTNVYDND